MGLGVRANAVPAVGGTVVAPDVVRRGGGPAGQADADSGRSGKGKEPAEAEAGLEAGCDGSASCAGAGAVGGDGKGKGRADNGSARSVERAGVSGRHQMEKRKPQGGGGSKHV